MPRGGARNGTPGKAYGNRSDLRSAKPIPGGQYGEQTQQAQVITATPQAPEPPIPAGPGPGALGPLDRPTERPGEPMSAGAPWGPGANNLGMSNPTSPDVVRLQRQLPLLQILASNPNSSNQTRMLYRQVLLSHLDTQE